MFTIINPQLEELILSSQTLKHKLTDEQIQKFLGKARTLPPEGQDELIAQLQAEQTEYKEYLFEAAKKLAILDQQTQVEVMEMAKQIRAEAEEQNKKTEMQREKDLLQELEQINS